MELLLETPGVDVNAKDNDGWTPLRLAVGVGFAVTKLLVIKKYIINILNIINFPFLHKKNCILLMFVLHYYYIVWTH